MKKIILAIFLLGMSVYTYAQDGIHFMDYKKTTFDQVLTKAQEENKIVFVDIWTTWCGPCKLLKQTTFTDPEVGRFFNDHFINIDFDAEDSEWVAITERYYATAFPTLLFIAPDGKVIWAAENLQISMNDESGKPVAIGHLLEQAQMVLDYCSLPAEKFFNALNWKRVCRYGTDSSNEIFKSIVKNKDSLEKIYDDAVARQIRRALEQDAANIFRKASGKYVLNQEKYDYVKATAACLGAEEQARIVLGMDVSIAAEEKNWNKLTALVEKGFADKILDVVSRAWYAEDYIECDRSDLKAKARSWVEEAMKEKKDDSRIRQIFRQMLKDLSK